MENKKEIERLQLIIDDLKCQIKALKGDGKGFEEVELNYKAAI